MAAPKRLPWLYTQYPIYYITACTHERRRILHRGDVHEAFVRFGLAGPDYGVWIGGCVLMPDHIHLFAGFGPESMSMSAWVKALKRTISKVWTNADVRPPHWQKGFFDHVIRSSVSYEEKWQYVKDNPSRAGLVSNQEPWPFSGEIWEFHTIEGKDAR